MYGVGWDAAVAGPPPSSPATGSPEPRSPTAITVVTERLNERDRKIPIFPPGKYRVVAAWCVLRLPHFRP